MTLSFHNDPALRDKYVARVNAHIEADELIHGKYWEDGKGCAVGCTIHSADHRAYETELGLPEWLARLEDTLFEGQSNDDARTFVREFLPSIPVGVDLTPVRWRFCAFLMRENIERVTAEIEHVLTLEISDELKKQIVHAQRQVTAALEQTLTLHEAETDDEAAARSAARSAAWSAAEAAYKRYADKLLELLREAA